MTLLVDIKAFLATARTGSFSAAAREIGVAPSVVTKRVGRLENHIGNRLFVRSTRALVMTSEADRLRPRLQMLVSQLDDALEGAAPPETGLAGHVRIKAPTTLGTLFAGRSIARFMAQNPAITTELMLIDRAVNPLEEGFDIALGGLPQSFASVHETPLCYYPRVLVATPEYLAEHGSPKTPGDLVEHRCIIYVAAGMTWFFESEGGPISVTVNPVFTVNDSRLLHFAALHHLGICIAPGFLVQDDLAEGRLVEVIPDFPVTQLWFKAMVPNNKLHRPEVAALLEFLKKEFEAAPWETEPVPRL